jgi:PAS domain S-box-containing protein
MNEKPCESAEARSVPEAPNLRVARHGLLIMTGPADGIRILFANAHFEALTGYLSPEIADRAPFFLLDDADDDKRRIGQTMAAGQPSRAVLHVLRKDGSRLRVSVEVDPIRDAFGTVTHFIAAVEDASGSRC